MTINGHGGSALAHDHGPAASDDVRRRKADLRARALARRAEIWRRAGVDAGASLAERFLEAVSPPSAGIVSAYVPLLHEIDVWPLLTRLHARGHGCALPVAERRGVPLVFRQWAPDTPLSPGLFGVPEPDGGSPVLRPDLVGVPLVAFDRAGGRLGYGAGFYDRTLAALRRTAPVVAVGIAFAGQEWPQVPTEPHDEPLDWIITEREAIRVAPAAGAP